MSEGTHDRGLPWQRHNALRVLARAWPGLEAHAPPSRATLAAWLARAEGPALRPVEPRQGSADDYERAVTEGSVPTREGSWHDAFNVLAFVAFPRTKRALHHRVLELRRARVAAGGRAGVRSREEDALALLDEGALVVAGAPPGIAALAQARRDGALDRIDAVVRSQGLVVHVLGHALLEHLVLDRRPIGAGVLPVPIVGPLTLAAIDDALAARIAAGGFPAPCVSPTVPWPDPRVDAWISAPSHEPGNLSPSPGVRVQ